MIQTLDNTLEHNKKADLSPGYKGDVETEQRFCWSSPGAGKHVESNELTCMRTMAMQYLPGNSTCRLDAHLAYVIRLLDLISAKIGKYIT